MRGVRLGLVFLAGCAVAETAAVPPRRGEIPLPLLESLGDPDPEVRCRAETELRQLARSAEPVLREWATHPDPEVAGRCRDLLRGLEAARHLPVGRVVTLDAGRRTLHLDPAQGRTFQAGERFELLRGKSWVASAEFTRYVGSPPLARMLVIDGDADGFQEYELTVVPGDPDVRREAQAAPVEATLTLVDEDPPYLEVGYRQRDGVRPGEVLNVFRDDRLVGRVVILEVAPCASLVAPWDGTRVEDLRCGDRVEPREGAAPTSRTSAR